MVGSNGTMLAISLVRSKLRKREEHNTNTVHPAADVVLRTGPRPVNSNSSVTTQQVNDQTQNNNNNTTTTTLTTTTFTDHHQVLWQFPPPPVQPYLYSNNQNTLVQSLPTERPGFVRGFRKNLGGRFRRLVKKKPPEVYTIPAELKPQLKQIYVY